MFLNLATQEDIVDIACTFPAGKSAGYDNIPMSIIKRSIGSISSPLTHIINPSIIQGIIPDESKIARVVPIFKSGDKALFSNYRPISVLPCFSKFLERIIYNRIINYLNGCTIGEYFPRVLMMHKRVTKKNTKIYHDNLFAKI